MRCESCTNSPPSKHGVIIPFGHSQITIDFNTVLTRVLLCNKKCTYRLPSFYDVLSPFRVVFGLQHWRVFVFANSTTGVQLLLYLLNCLYKIGWSTCRRMGHCSRVLSLRWLWRYLLKTTVNRRLLVDESDRHVVWWHRML